MAHGVVHHFAGGTKEQYDASIGAVHPGPGRLPEGQVFHAAGPSDGGWTIVAIHESRESWERFRDGVLMPTMAKGIEGGFAAPPQEIDEALHDALDRFRRAVAADRALPIDRQLIARLPSPQRAPALPLARRRGSRTVTK